MTALAMELAPKARFHPRVEAGFMVKLLRRGRSIVAKASDLSMAGMRVMGELAPTGERVTVTLPLPGDRQIVTEATVRRRGADDTAIEFDQLDWDDMFALARYLNPRLR